MIAPDSSETTTAAQKRVARKIILQAIKDLNSGDERHRLSAQYYIAQELFEQDCTRSGYPPELRDTLRDSVLSSSAQRFYLFREILVLLRENGKDSP